MAGAIFYLRANVQVMGVPVPLLTGAIYAGVVGPIALLCCLFLPSLRFMIEAVAVSRLAFACFVYYVPEIGYKILASPFLTALVVVTGGALVSRLIHGRIRRAKVDGWREHYSLRRIVTRTPANLTARPWQQRFVGWIDDTAPVTA